MKIRELGSIDFKNKRVLLRTDYNVPVENNVITDDRRIKSTVKTINYLLEKNAKVIIISHLGRPKGREEKCSLKIVKKNLEKHLNREILFIDDIKANGVKEQIDKLPFPSVVMFENIRFYKEEQKQDPAFAEFLSKFGDVYVNDGFGVAHRGDVSVQMLAYKFKERAAGFLIAEEVKHLSYLNENPKNPYVFIVGGSKVSTKIQIIDNILEHASTVIIGGGLAFTFLKAQGFEIGKSLFEEDMISECKRIYSIAREKNVNILLPLDFAVAESVDSNKRREVKRDEIKENDIGLDIGELSAEIFKAAIESAKTVVWNGPMGLFENSAFACGTLEIAKAIADATKNKAFTVAGGGDSCSAIDQMNLKDSFSYISTGGGAMLEFLSGLKLPGIEALKEEE
ncbi:TPA: phosphoglycerate kinase [candidate division WOR-3 bacterium]|jgi:phosphoglycerate kinase|uniref:Phosphoglycerate kinase n=1 Tax=candidate division WOR-3 bacterium TaxID=2052148 RepID=A0A350HCG3_UNCW3|nr:phosphoglycerate kinase [candidate division WOR-3 bacterium]